MKRGIIYFFIGLSLLVWLVEMFTDWFDQALLRQFIRGALGFGFMIFVVFLMGMEWLKGESHDGG
ncbi:hypothetical protein [Streptococcus pneumoniae]|uniref:Uncharacterized protein n=3 Tax=Streptococcus pneumoniae TaxID=1313 RepID=A0A098Z5S2_STREE|nr:hypothetical protein [Streptococcus pneumoniae]EDK62776.1 hypothetical protein CGSSp11BS70_11546 [Streptococcus pneumoniae SP11-BS70]EGI82678.1 putative membrane protein [Streptococcus pneumoniae GA41301]EHD71904.1 putative membrane protein [Streptococcus pneumoniae GA44194]EHD75600.1 putative membrane protein [Streptococcus pneumoniae GA44511]EHE01108.1 putative membrane protein [Streptococcus pneumoniae GA17227]EHE48640.1 putative membrane protein [Streptococcus pneumoniae GA54644]EHN60